MVSVDDLINKKQEEETSRINKELEKSKKSFEFIRYFLRENFHEIANYVADNDNSSVKFSEKCYNLTKEVSNLIKKSHVGETYVELKELSTLKSLKDYLPVKLGFFEINGDDEKGYLVLTEKGKNNKKGIF